jgi:hypothetical protein
MFAWISETSSEISESQNKKNLGISEWEKCRNLEKEKSRNLRKGIISKSQNNRKSRNLGTSEISESQSEQTLGISQTSSEVSESRKSQNLGSLGISEIPESWTPETTEILES